MKGDIQNLVVLAEVFSSSAAFGNGFIVCQNCLESGNICKRQFCIFMFPFCVEAWQSLKLL